MYIGSYRLLTHLGAGEPGDWYAAQDERGRPVRLLVSQNAEAGEAWRETETRLRLIDQLRSSAIIPLLHLGLDHSPPYAVWAETPSTALREELQHTDRWSDARALNVVLDVAGALAAAHRLGLVHGRVAPSEIYLVDDGARLDFAHSVDVGDIGMRTVRDPDSSLRHRDLHREGEGSAEHRASPNQGFREGPARQEPRLPDKSHPGSVAGGRPPRSDGADPSVDVFNLGMILYRMVHGYEAAGPVPQSFMGESFEVKSLHMLIEWMLAEDAYHRPTAVETADVAARLLNDVEDHRQTRIRPGAERPTPIVTYPGEIDPTPKNLGRYRLLKRLGEGGLGVVFLARDTATDQQVAIKVLHRRHVDSSRIIRRFKKEARLLAEIPSPHVCRLIDFNDDAGRHYLVMEYLQGETLAKVVERRRPVPETLALTIIADAARALAEAHRRGIVHRDIKPENIMLVGSWSRLAEDLASGVHVMEATGDVRVKLCDFGMARHIDQSESLDITQAGTSMGTPLYMSPEQANGETDISPRSDVYSLGVTLFHLLAGRPPFTAKTIPALISMHIKEDAPSPLAFNPDLSAGAAQVVLKTLAKAPEARYADAEELLRDLERLLRGEPTDVAVHPRLPDHQPGELIAYDWCWDLDASPAQLWPYVSNTERVNHAAGLPAVAYSHRAAASLDPTLAIRVERFGTFRKAGVANTWREHAYEWVEGKRLGVLREYTEGVFRWFTSTVELRARVDGGTTLFHSVRIVPRGRFGRIIAALEVGYKGRRALDAVYKRIDGYLAQGDSTPPASDAFLPRAGASIEDERVRRPLVDRLIRRGVELGLAERMVAYFLAAPEQVIARIRPIALAHRLRREPNEVIDACLIAAHEGLLVLLWDLLCPRCRIPASVAETMKAITSHGRCEACYLDFELDFTNAVEVVFRVQPSLRSSETGVFCAGGPAHSPHVVAQVRVAAGERLELSLELVEGSYRLRGPQLPYVIDFRVHPEARAQRGELLVRRGPGAEFPRTFHTGTQTLVLTNDHREELVVRLERTASRADALTAARASSLARFRELFPQEILSANQLVSIAHVAFVTTALAEVARLYERGDTRAFAVLHEHFRLVEEHVRKESGALVKTVQEGVVAVFHDPAAAVRVGLELHKVLDKSEATRDLKLRVGVHSGPAMAATLNDKLDYFGATVNAAMSLPHFADAGEVIISLSLMADSQVQTLLSARGLVGEVLDGSPPGLVLHRLISAADARSNFSPPIIKLQRISPAL